MSRPRRSSVVGTATRTLAAIGALALPVALAGCNGEQSPSSSPSAGGSGSSSSTTVAPAMVEADGYSRLNTLPAPVASQDFVDNSWKDPRSARVEVVQAATVGGATRVVVAWDQPTDGEVALTERMRSSSPGASSLEIGLQLYDPVAGTVTEPLRTADGTCLCSKNTGRFIDKDKQALFWADFPTPVNDSVTLLMGEQVPPLQDVKISTAESALDLSSAGELADWVENAPPTTVGEGAGAPQVIPVRRSVRSYGGAEDSQLGKNADVSLPSDVLFAFDSSALNAKAKAVLAAAAPKLAAAAKGQRVQVVGHTDDQGTPGYNKALSLRRAQAVAAYLAPRLRSAGITLVPVGKGESEHIVPNTDKDGDPIPENRQRNRRVSFVFGRADASQRTGIDAPAALPKMATATRTTASPEVTGSLASVLSTDGKTRIDVTRVQRSGPDLWLAMSFTSVSGERTAWGNNELPLGPNPYGANDTLGNVQVVDEASRVLATAVTFGSGNCLCSENQGSGDLFAKPLSLWAVFPAPKEGVTKVTLRIPGSGQVVALPIS